MYQIHPQSIKTLDGKVVVKKYQRPDVSPGGIIIPKAFNEDKGLQLWEYVAGGDFGYNITEGSILKTRQTFPTDTGLDDERDGRRLFFLPQNRVFHITHNTWEANADDTDH